MAAFYGRTARETRLGEGTLYPWTGITIIFNDIVRFECPNTFFSRQDLRQWIRFWGHISILKRCAEMEMK